MTNAYAENIIGWTILTGKCSECDSPEVVVRVQSFRKYKSKRIISGNHSHDYCKKHIPEQVLADMKDWEEELGMRVQP